MIELDWRRQEEEFNLIWENRHQEPYVTESWTDNDWARGRTDYLTFLIRVREGKILDRIKEIQSELARYECVDTFPEEYFHITVKELGCFLVSEKTASDELTRDELPALINEAREKLKHYKPFELRLKNLNNFKSTVCVQAHDGGVVRNINRTLLQILGVRELRHDWDFLPHLSVAQYKSTDNYEQLIQHLEKNRGTKVGPLRVESIEILIAKLPIKGRYPKLKTLEEFRLE